MLEDDLITISTLFFVIFILYIFGSIVVGMLSKQYSLGFRVGFIWSVVFTPLIGLIIVLKNSHRKEKQAL